MGVKMEVSAWVKVPHGYDWKTAYYGNSVVRGLWCAAKAKRYAGCVKIEWRG